MGNIANGTNNDTQPRGIPSIDQLIIGFWKAQWTSILSLRFKSERTFGTGFIRARLHIQSSDREGNLSGFEYGQCYALFSGNSLGSKKMERVGWVFFALLSTTIQIFTLEMAAFHFQECAPQKRPRKWSIDQSWETSLAHYSDWLPSNWNNWHDSREQIVIVLPTLPSLKPKSRESNVITW